MAAEQPLRYRAYLWDAELGLYHMPARSYDPALGRFLSADPARPKSGDPLSLNRYAYAADNPVNLMDADGREPHGQGMADGYEPEGGDSGYNYGKKPGQSTMAEANAHADEINRRNRERRRPRENRLLVQYGRYLSKAGTVAGALSIVATGVLFVAGGAAMTAAAPAMLIAGLIIGGVSVTGALLRYNGHERGYTAGEAQRDVAFGLLSMAGAGKVRGVGIALESAGEAGRAAGVYGLVNSGLDAVYMSVSNSE